jgi:hypothetical protein
MSAPDGVSLTNLVTFSPVRPTTATGGLTWRPYARSDACLLPISDVLRARRRGHCAAVRRPPGSVSMSAVELVEWLACYDAQLRWSRAAGQLDPNDLPGFRAAYDKLIAIACDLRCDQLPVSRAAAGSLLKRPGERNSFWSWTSRPLTAVRPGAQVETLFGSRNSRRYSSTVHPWRVRRCCPPTCRNHSPQRLALHAILVGVVGQLPDWCEVRRPIGQPTQFATAPAQAGAGRCRRCLRGWLIAHEYFSWQGRRALRQRDNDDRTTPTPPPDRPLVLVPDFVAPELGGDQLRHGCRGRASP